MVEDLPFRVEEWDVEWRGRISTLAAAADLMAARAAYRVLVERRPDAAMMLCDRARVVEKTGPGQENETAE